MQFRMGLVQLTTCFTRVRQRVGRAGSPPQPRAVRQRAAGRRWMLMEHVPRLSGTPVGPCGSLEILGALAKSSWVCVSSVNPRDKQTLL